MHELQADQQPESESRERKPYTAPRIEESARFEHLVLACLMNSSSSECVDGPLQSM
ncbi:MAG TPA: hypothetical protein VJV78_08720 [Polyangiales bacterium]|nr:hypothetical protein [Polyangiales bacterium]